MSRLYGSIPPVDLVGSLLSPHHPVLRRALLRLADSPVPATLGVVSTALLAQCVVGAKPSLAALAAVVAIAYASYSVDRIVDRVRAGRSPGASLLGSAFASFCFASGTAYVLSGAAAALCALVFPLSVAAYCLPWLGFSGALERRGIRRVKDIPFTKNAYTSLCVTGCAVWATWASGTHDARSLLAVAFAAFTPVLVNTAACDIGDVEDDVRDGVPTFAVRFGRRATAYGLRVLNCSWALWLTLGAVFGLYAPCAIAAAAGAILVDSHLRVLSRPAPAIVADLAPDFANFGIAMLALIAHSVFGG